MAISSYHTDQEKIPPPKDVKCCLTCLFNSCLIQNIKMIRKTERLRTERKTQKTITTKKKKP